MKGSYATGIATLFWIALWVLFPQSKKIRISTDLGGLLYCCVLLLLFYCLKSYIVILIKVIRGRLWKFML